MAPEASAAAVHEEKQGIERSPPSTSSAEENQDSSNNEDPKDFVPEPLRRQTTAGHHLGSFFFRTDDNDDEQDWWFASTAIPLLAATLGPLANVCSVAALVVYWRMDLIDPNTGEQLTQLEGIPFRDPKWCYDLNVISLIFGFVGNLFLLLNFTNRIRYIIALPVTIFFWYIATSFLIGITVHMDIHDPPIRPQQTYTQGYWYAVISAVLYLICSMGLMGNMLGYFLGHYPQHFNLTDSQRTLILQTMLFFIWLAGGGFMFARIENEYGLVGWNFTTALYFCDVTILTVGFGDEYPTDNVGRGVVFPYSVVGIIMLGLMISSISKFAAEIGQKNVVKHQLEKQRQRTIERSISASDEVAEPERKIFTKHPEISGPTEARPMRTMSERDITFSDMEHERPDKSITTKGKPKGLTLGLKRAATMVGKIAPVSQNKMLLLREEKDRFEAMRQIQNSTNRFKQYTALSLSFLAFSVLWAVGAVVFWQCEKDVQDMTYFKALYLGYVSLLTIGYGDLAPKSNAGRPFFVVWSLLAVPTMTILISHMGDTVIASFNEGTNALADFTVLPQKGVWRKFLNKNPWLLLWIEHWMAKRAEKKRLETGFPDGPDPNEEQEYVAPTIEELAEDGAPDVHELAKRLALAIRQVAHDLKTHSQKEYTFEEWADFTEMIRFTSVPALDRPMDPHEEEEEEELIEWDWIGEDSPMMVEQTEPEFVLDRLTESMGRYIRRQDPLNHHKVAEGRRLSASRRISGLESIEEEGWRRRPSRLSEVSRV